MPCHVKRLAPDGLKPVAYEASSLADAARFEPDNGVYTVTNTYNRTRVLKFDAHLDRLEDSAQRTGIHLTLSRTRLRRALRTMIEEAGWGDVRFRITITRDDPGQPILSIEPFSPPDISMIERGVRCITAADSARSDARTKSTNWMHDRQALMAAKGPEIYEVFLMDHTGHVLEGLSSNFYAIHQGELFTADEGILQGISRQIVLQIAPEIVDLRLQPIQHDDIPKIDEAFLTSSSRGIIPVVEMDGIYIGSGQPGPITHKLRSAYNQWVQVHLEEL